MTQPHVLILCHQRVQDCYMLSHNTTRNVSSCYYTCVLILRHQRAQGARAHTCCLIMLLCVLMLLRLCLHITMHTLLVIQLYTCALILLCVRILLNASGSEHSHRGPTLLHCVTHTHTLSLIHIIYNIYIERDTYICIFIFIYIYIYI